MNTKSDSILAAWIVTARNRLLAFDRVAKDAYGAAARYETELAAMQAAYPIPLDPPQEDEPGDEEYETYWAEPIDELCPDCGEQLHAIVKRPDIILCMADGCQYGCEGDDGDQEGGA